MSDVFYLDTEDGSVSCHVLTTLYSLVYHHHYLVYEMENSKDEVYVSIYEPGEEIRELIDVEGKELDDLVSFLESDYGEEL